MIGALGAIALAGCGGSAGVPSPHAAVTTIASSSHARPLVAAASRRVPAVPPSLLALQSVLGRGFAQAGPGTGGEVYDLTTRQTLYVLRPSLPRPPASVEKLYTTIAVLSDLGPSAQLHTDVLGSGHLGAAGVWDGNLYLRGGGDPTFGDGEFNRVWEQGYGPTAAELAAQLRAAGIRRVTGELIGDASLFDGRPGVPSSAFAPDIPDLGGELSALTYDHGATGGSLTPGAFAARQLARTLRAQGVAVRAAPLIGLTPGGAKLLASVSSPPTSILVRLMDVPSDDLFAEMLTKQLGVRFGSGGTTSAGVSVIRGVVAGYGVHPAIVDGSGLSRSDQSSPEQIVALLRGVWHTEIGRELDLALPVVGISGTVAGIALKTAAVGHCIAKTGTLNGVTNLAGYCDSHDHHIVAFALLLDGPSNGEGYVLLGRMVAAIARY